MVTDTTTITKAPCPCGDGSCGYCKDGHLVCKCCGEYVDASDHHTYDEYAWCGACKAVIKFNSDGSPVECHECGGHVEESQDAIDTDYEYIETCHQCEVSNDWDETYRSLSRA